MQYVLRTPDIVVKVTNREDTLHVGGEEGGGGVGGIWLLSVFNMKTAFCLLRLIETLSYPSMSKRRPTLHRPESRDISGNFKRTPRA